MTLDTKFESTNRITNSKEKKRKLESTSWRKFVNDLATEDEIAEDEKQKKSKSTTKNEGKQLGLSSMGEGRSDNQ